MSKSRRQDEEDEQVAAVYTFAEAGLAVGKFPGDIEKMLVKRGLDAVSARNAIEMLVEEQFATKPTLTGRRPQSGLAKMALGAIWFVGGIAVTIFTYEAASAAGVGTYMVAWGAVVYGAFQFFRGLTED